MAYRELELTLLSARDLKNVNLFMSMDVYAVASISGDPMTRRCTPTDTTGGSNPSWNAMLRFSVPPTAKDAAGGWLHVLLRSERALGDRDVGEVIVPLAELLAAADGPGPQPPRLVSYQVHTVHRGEPRGVLNVSYRLGPVVAPVDNKQQQPAIGHPVPPYHQPPQQQPVHRPPAPPQPVHRQIPPPQQPHNPPPSITYAPSPRPRREAAPAPAKGEGNDHGPTQVIMGPQTQIIFQGGGNGSPTQPKTVPTKPDGPKPKPSYTPQTQPKSNPVKPDHSWPKPLPQHQDAPTWPKPVPQQHQDAPTWPKPVQQHQNDPTWPKPVQQHQDTPTWPNSGPKKPIQQDTRAGVDHSQIQARPKEAYANNMTGGKADHWSGPKTVMQHSMPTATAR